MCRTLLSFYISSGKRTLVTMINTNAFFFNLFTIFFSQTKRNSCIITCMKVQSHHLNNRSFSQKISNQPYLYLSSPYTGNVKSTFSSIFHSKFSHGSIQGRIAETENAEIYPKDFFVLTSVPAPATMHFFFFFNQCKSNFS